METSDRISKREDSTSSRPIQTTSRPDHVTLSILKSLQLFVKRMLQWDLMAPEGACVMTRPSVSMDVTSCVVGEGSRLKITSPKNDVTAYSIGVVRSRVRYASGLDRDIDACDWVKLKSRDEYIIQRESRSRACWGDAHNVRKTRDDYNRTVCDVHNTF